MIWTKFRDESFRLTEKDSEKMIPHIISQYKQAIKDIEDQLKEVHTKILSGLNPDEYYNAMLKHNRLEKLLNEISRGYIKYSKEAGKYIKQSGQIAFSNNYYRSLYSVQWLNTISFAVIPKDLIELSVNGTKEAWKIYQKTAKKVFGSGLNYIPKHGTLTEILLQNRIKEIDSIQRVITQGLMQGQSYQKTSMALRDIIGRTITKNGVKSTTGCMANAVRIVRTENNRIMNQAATANTERAKSEGIDVVRVWSASLDRRTRPEHANLDDKRENKDGFFDTSYGPVKGPGLFPTVGQNVNCRCTTWESVDGSSPALRRGRNPVTGENEVFEYKDFKQWASDNGLKTNKYGEIIPTK